MLQHVFRHVKQYYIYQNKLKECQNIVTNVGMVWYDVTKQLLKKIFTNHKTLQERQFNDNSIFTPKETMKCN